MRRLITLFAAILGILVLAAFAYFIWDFVGRDFFFPLAPPPPPATVRAMGPSYEAPLAAYLPKEGKVLGVQTDGQIVEIQGGNAVILSSSKINSLLDASFSFDGRKVLVKFGTHASPAWSIYDIASSAWTGIDLKLSSAAWNPGAAEIAYLEKVNSVSNIGILKPDELADAKKPEAGAKRETLASLSEVDSEILWLDQNELIISSRPSKYAKGFILKYKIKEKIFELVAEEKGAVVLWDAKNRLGLRFNSQNKGNLALLDTAGRVVKELNFLTLPDKCAFTILHLYCAVPEDDLARLDLPDDHDKEAVFFKDSFYRIGLQDGNVESLFANDNPLFDAYALHPLSDRVYFLNKSDKRLYEFPIR